MPALPGAFPSAGAMPGLPGLPSTPAPVFGAGGAVPTPPPLTALATGPDIKGPTTGGLVKAQGPMETYEFLFREDPDMGIVREKYSYEEAQKTKAAEVGRMMQKYTGAAGANPGQQRPQGQDPRAGAEWDFYYEQYQLYNDYVREKVLAGAKDLPEPAYDEKNFLQESTDIKNAYQKAALTLMNTQHNENLDFYDVRLAGREERRRRYYEWLASQQKELDEWAKMWSRKINARQWVAAGDQPIRRDDWYYGSNFSSNLPKTIQVEGQKYLLSQEAQSKVPPDQLNVITSNLTPYDIIDRNGELKKPELERLRGTIVRPPAAEGTTGTVELGL